MQSMAHRVTTHTIISAALLLCAALPFATGGADRSASVRLAFTMMQDHDLIDLSDYGEPPQFAIWLENPATEEVRTVFVTYRTATGDFEGRVSCPLSLPLWIGIFRVEFNKTGFPRPWEPVADAITGATPKTKRIRVTAEVPAGSEWNYYIEMNLAGDFNDHYPSRIDNYGPDKYGNGQPSLIFKGSIVANIGQSSTPVIAGRTDQIYFTTEINPDLQGIDSARNVFYDILITCEAQR